MIKNLIVLFFIITINSFSTIWNFNGLDGEAGIILIYKTLPPLTVEVEQPEKMVVSKEQKNFKYSEVSPSRKPLQVKIEIKFNDSIIEANNINKEIIRTIYDSAKLSFLNEGKFSLIKHTQENGMKKNKELLPVEETIIDAEAFFTNDKALFEGKEIERVLKDSIQGGTLTRQDIYIDAEFNKNNKILLAGEYSGSITLVVEFIGKGVAY